MMQHKAIQFGDNQIQPCQMVMLRNAFWSIPSDD